MEDLTTKSCLNCNTVLKGNFCHHCGQKDIPKRLTWKEVWNDLIGRLFGVERGFWKTFKDLTLRPGYAIRDYLAGHRKVYQSPIQYYLIATALLFLIYNYFHIFDTFRDGSFNAQLQGVDKVDANQQKMLAVMAPILDNMRYIIGAVPPLLALTYKWFFKKRTGFTYIECLVFAVFVVAHSGFLSLVLAPIIAYLGSSSVFLSTIFGLLYICWAAKQFFQTNWFKTIIAYVIGYTLFFLCFIFLVIIPYIAYIIISNQGLPQ